MPAASVVFLLYPDDYREAKFLTGVPPTGVQNVLLEQEKKDSIAALSLEDATRPMEPRRSLFFSVECFLVRPRIQLDHETKLGPVCIECASL